MTETNFSILAMPKKVYFKRGCTPVALRELSEVYHLKKAFIIHDSGLEKFGYLAKLRQQLAALDLRTAEFAAPKTAPTEAELKKALSQLHAFNPDVIVGLGGGAALNAAKVVALSAEAKERVWANPEEEVICDPSCHQHKLVLISTSFGNGAQTSPRIFLQEEDGKILTTCGSHILPEIAITDADFMDSLTTQQVDNGQRIMIKLCREICETCEGDRYVLGILDSVLSALENYSKDALQGSPLALEKMHNASALLGPTLSLLK